MLACVASRAKSLDVKFDIGGDFNMEPSVLCSPFVPARLGADGCCPAGVAGTCRSTGGIKMYDYALVEAR
eukprot:3112926-Pyramimonas_sp.AAC.1